MGSIALIPVLGAISIGCLDLTKLVFLFIIGMFLNIFLFVSNDIADAKLDRMSKLSRDYHARAIAKGTISKKTGIYISVISIIAPYILSLIFFYRESYTFYLGILVLSIGIILCTIYNIFGKHFITSAFLASIASGLGVIYGAYMTTDNIDLNIYTWLLFILVCNFMLFLTAIIGGYKDAGNDNKIGGKTIALFLGVKIDENKKTIITPVKFKTFTILIEIFSILVLLSPIIIFDIHYEFWKILLILFLGTLSIILSFKFLAITTYDNKKIYQIFVPLMILNSTFLALILFPVIAWYYVLFLAVFPQLWVTINLPILKLTKKYLPNPKSGDTNL